MARVPTGQPRLRRCGHGAHSLRQRPRVDTGLPSHVGPRRPATPSDAPRRPALHHAAQRRPATPSTACLPATPSDVHPPMRPCAHAPISLCTREKALPSHVAPFARRSLHTSLPSLFHRHWRATAHHTMSYRATGGSAPTGVVGAVCDFVAWSQVAPALLA
jgi:hypothetical protein